MKKFIIGFLTACFLILCAMVFRPVPSATENNTYDIHDEIVNVFEGPSYDVVFVLKNRKGYPYINRGLENGMNIVELNQKLRGKSVHLKFVDHWTPLDYDKSSPTVAYIKVEDSGEIVYNNIRG